MKSAYELAMERLEETSGPTVELTDEQRAELAAIDEKYTAQIAEKEVFLGGVISKAKEAGSFGEVAELERQLASEVSRIKEKCEAEKEKLRNAG